MGRLRLRRDIGDNSANILSPNHGSTQFCTSEITCTGPRKPEHSLVETSRTTPPA